MFIDLEKAFDRMPYSVIEGFKEAARAWEAAFEISVGVHQGSALSPLLFNLVMEEATKDCRRGVPWEILHADEIVLTAPSNTEMQEQFNRWMLLLCHGE